jgi:DNA-binding XRE family transcriptional regulator
MTKEVLLKKLGERITALRKEQSLSQTDLAHLCDWDRQALHKIEKAKVNPSIYVLHKIATELNIPLKELFDFE